MCASKTPKNVYNGDRSTSAFLKDLKHLPRWNAATTKEQCFKLQELNYIFWEQVLFYTPSVFLYWITEGIEHGYPKYRLKFESNILEETEALLKEYREENTAWKDSAEKSHLKEKMTEITKVILSFDGTRKLWDHVIQHAQSGEILVGIPLKNCETYYQQIVRTNMLVEKLRNKIVEGNIRFALQGALSVSKKYVGMRRKVSDYIQDASLGLLEAIHRYDPSTGYAFTTYASFWIRNRINRGRLQDKTVMFPFRLLDQHAQALAVQRKYAVLYNRAPSEEEVINEVESITPRVYEKLQWCSRTEEASLNTVPPDLQQEGDQDIQQQDLVEDNRPSIEEVLDHIEFLRLLQILLETSILLTKKERLLIREYFGLTNDDPKTYADLGRRYNLSREGVRKTIQHGLLKLKKGLIGRHRGKQEYLEEISSYDAYVARL